MFSLAHNCVIYHNWVKAVHYDTYKTTSVELGALNYFIIDHNFNCS